MTVAAGLVCKDGIVLSADTEMSVGDTGKFQQSKIISLDEIGGYAVYAGDAGFVAEIVPQLSKTVRSERGKPDIATTVGKEWKRCFTEHYTKPPKAEKRFAYLLITLWVADRLRLYCALAQNFYEVETFDILGTGADIARAAIAPFYDEDIGIQKAGILSVYGLLQAKGYAQFCGGKTEVLILRQLAKNKITVRKIDSVFEIEKDYSILNEAMKPVLWSFPDERTTDKEFKALLKTFASRLAAHRRARSQERARIEKAMERAVFRAMREADEEENP
jgi:20S proteasome alpha/beta subunit